MPWIFRLKVSLRIILSLLRALSRPGELLVLQSQEYVVARHLLLDPFAQGSSASAEPQVLGL